MCFLRIPSEISEGFPRKEEIPRNYFRGLVSSLFWNEGQCECTMHIAHLRIDTIPARDLSPSQLDPETRSQPARGRRLDTARDSSLFPALTRSQLATSVRLSSIPRHDLRQLAVDDWIPLAIAACFPLVIRLSQPQFATDDSKLDTRRDQLQLTTISFNPFATRSAHAQLAVLLIGGPFNPT
ncbi:hypothetical protein DY000_02046253 [Brassica cretica]|uniref:Anaphase-promoting complex subunit 1 n=1 Tax=Brassica cretica TaxID=69181 RepID=A0ABQ7F850_BRACR|nr:hypothetical protein DY000_02046253 [Brassica cretica]